MTDLQARYIPLLPEDCFASAKKIQFLRRQLDGFRAEQGRPLAILDFGCGNAAELGSFIINDIDSYVGVDIHQPSLDHARAHFSSDKTQFLDGLPQTRFDVVLVSEVLEHLDDPAGLLGLLVREHLAEDGIVLGSVPNGYGLTEIEKYVDQRLGLYGALRSVVRLARRVSGRAAAAQAAAAPYNHASGHVQFFTQAQLEKVARDSGLRLATLRNGSLMGADLSQVTILRPRFMLRLNTWIADYIPHWAAATWFFRMEPARSA